MYILVRKSFDTFISYNICDFFDNLYDLYDFVLFNELEDDDYEIYKVKKKIK